MTINLDKERTEFEAWWKDRCLETWRSSLLPSELDKPMPAMWGEGFKRYALQGWQARASIPPAAAQPEQGMGAIDRLAMSGERALKEMLSDLHREYQQRAAPLVKALAAFEMLKPPPPVFLSLPDSQMEHLRSLIPQPSSDALVPPLGQQREAALQALVDQGQEWERTAP